MHSRAIGGGIWIPAVACLIEENVGLTDQEKSPSADATKVMIAVAKLIMVNTALVDSFVLDGVVVVPAIEKSHLEMYARIFSTT